MSKCTKKKLVNGIINDVLYNIIRNICVCMEDTLKPCAAMDEYAKSGKDATMNIFPRAFESFSDEIYVSLSKAPWSQKQMESLCYIRANKKDNYKNVYLFRQTYGENVFHLILCVFYYCGICAKDYD